VYWHSLANEPVISLLWKNNIYYRDLQLVFQSIKYHVIEARFCVLLWYLWTNLWNGVVFVLDMVYVIMRWTLNPARYVLLVEESCNLNWNGGTNKALSTGNITAARQRLSSVVDFFLQLWGATSPLR